MDKFVVQMQDTDMDFVQMQDKLIDYLLYTDMGFVYLQYKVFENLQETWKYKASYLDRYKLFESLRFPVHHIVQLQGLFQSQVVSLCTVVEN